MHIEAQTQLGFIHFKPNDIPSADTKTATADRKEAITAFTNVIEEADAYLREHSDDASIRQQAEDARHCLSVARALPEEKSFIHITESISNSDDDNHTPTVSPSSSK